MGDQPQDTETNLPMPWGPLRLRSTEKKMGNLPYEGVMNQEFSLYPPNKGFFPGWGGVAWGWGISNSHQNQHQRSKVLKNQKQDNSLPGAIHVLYQAMFKSLPNHRNYTEDDWVVVSNIFFSPLLGEDSNSTNIFQMGWNHQLDVDRYASLCCNSLVPFNHGDSRLRHCSWFSGLVFSLPLGVFVSC